MSKKWKETNCFAKTNSLAKLLATPLHEPDGDRTRSIDTGNDHLTIRANPHNKIFFFNFKSFFFNKFQIRSCFFSKNGIEITYNFISKLMISLSRGRLFQMTLFHQRVNIQIIFSVYSIYVAYLLRPVDNTDINFLVTEIQGPEICELSNLP